MKAAQMMTYMAACLVLNMQSASGGVLEIDFSTSTLNNQATGHLGGWFSDQMSFGEWYGPADAINMGDHGLTVYNSTTSSFRGTVIFLDPLLFGGEAGTYRLQFDVTEISFFSDSNNPDTPISGTPGVNGSGWVGIVEVNGYNLDLDSGDAIFVNTTPPNAGAVFAALGNASIQDLATLVIETTGSYGMDFTYSGTGAVGLALGSIDSSWPHTLINYDNVVLIPELS